MPESDHMKEITFKITNQEDIEALEQWEHQQVEKIKEAQGGTLYTGAIGGLFSYTFTPTNVGTIVKVTNGLNNESIDLFGDL